MLLTLCAAPTSPGPGLTAARLPRARPGARDLQVQELYLVETRTSLPEVRLALLSQLLHGAKPWPGPEAVPAGTRLQLVAPRTGCISAWSSKATELLRRAGLHEILRIEKIQAWLQGTNTAPALSEQDLYDPLTEQLLSGSEALQKLFQSAPPPAVRRYPLDETPNGEESVVLERACRELGITITPEELQTLQRRLREISHHPSDAELMIYGQINSEHCRHKIFNGRWFLDGKALQCSPFGWIRSTCPPERKDILSAYADNAAVRRGVRARLWYPDPDRIYRVHEEQAELLAKVETHNHPTAVCPYPGAATGAGGELRDEAATGRGARPLAGITGFCVSHLHLPDRALPWEEKRDRPPQLAEALRIMLEAPLGACDYNNEFGRPNLGGFFRSFEQAATRENPERGYHKPIMLAGGCGLIRSMQVRKQPLQPGDLLLVLGGPGMLIGLGGGSASSMASGTQSAELDFASVQRGNAELQRRCQEVIDRCWALGTENPILALHDVGAGGLGNALAELVHGKGATLELEAFPSADPSMGPLELCCNEAQERYVLALRQSALEGFSRICSRERAPWALLGKVTRQERFRITQNKNPATSTQAPIDLPMELLFPPGPGTTVASHSRATVARPATGETRRFLEDMDLGEAAQRILTMPTVAAKTFLITIGDRWVGGLTTRDPMVGPWQLPVADCAVSAVGFQDNAGFAMAVGERSPVALYDPPAAARLAVCESITNLCAARILHLQQVLLSGNWMAAAESPEERADLYRAVQALGEYCQALEVPVPVGKDSLSMRCLWEGAGGQPREMLSPISPVVSAFAPVAETAATLTPMLRGQPGESLLLHIDLGLGQRRLGASILEQVFQHPLGPPPDAPPPETLAHFFRTIQILNETGLLRAYHDCSDGGLFVTLFEMAITARRGLKIDLDSARGSVAAQCFAEEAGAVIEVRKEDVPAVQKLFQEKSAAPLHPIASLLREPELQIHENGKRIQRLELDTLLQSWYETSLCFRKLRDDPACASEERDTLLDGKDPGLHARIPPVAKVIPPPHAIPLQQDPPHQAPPGKEPSCLSRQEESRQEESRQEEPGNKLAANQDGAPRIGGARPLVAILREQGVNGHSELAAAFHHAGFQCADVHMNDLLQGAFKLQDCHGLAAAGGFSFGDVLGAGAGWAASILCHPKLRDMFSEFFAREESFSLGICNGCQMLARVKQLIPGAAHWPLPTTNRSGRFEARQLMVEIPSSPSILLQGMEGIRLPIVVAHAEGRFPKPTGPEAIPALRYLERKRYPGNPNGSSDGLAGFTSLDGRATILMPHPERVFLNRQFSWRPPELQGHESPWAQLFHNARRILKS